MPDTYTFILDVGGGTYMSQKDANSVEVALKLWAESADEAVIKAFEVDSEIHIREAVDYVVTSQDAIVPISELKSAWFVSLQIKDIDGFLNIIKTA